jgi:hypothetical protein
MEDGRSANQSAGVIVTVVLLWVCTSFALGLGWAYLHWSLQRARTTSPEELPAAQGQPAVPVPAAGPTIELPSPRVAAEPGTSQVGSNSGDPLARQAATSA